MEFIQFITSVLVTTFIMYVLLLLINILLKISTWKNQEEPNIFGVLFIGFILEVWKIIYNLF